MSLKQRAMLRIVLIRMLKSSILIFGSILVFNSCSSDEVLSLDEQHESKILGAYDEECRWVYAQMNHDYLWRKDMPDSLACDYTTDPVTFFKSLLSSKDKFSYSTHNSSYVGTSDFVKYGFEYQEYTDGNTNFAQVLYVTSPKLKERGLKRGDLVQLHDNKIILGVLCSNGFESRDTIEGSSPFEQTTTVYLDSIYQIERKKVGYMCYLQFNNKKDLTNVLKHFYEEQIDELVLDLRYNPGGLVSICKYLSNSVISENGYGEIFQQCTYNDILSREYFEATGSEKTFNHFRIPNNGKGLPGSELYGLNLKRIFVLTSKYSASASEALIISLKPFMSVVVIGEQTYGKGVGSWTIRNNKYKYQLQPITMQYYNAKMETVTTDGIPVDYYVPDGYSTTKRNLGDVEEPLLKTALDLIKMEKLVMGGNACSRSVAFEEQNEGFKAIGKPSFWRDY